MINCQYASSTASCRFRPVVPNPHPVMWRECCDKYWNLRASVGQFSLAGDSVTSPPVPARYPPGSAVVRTASITLDARTPAGPDGSESETAERHLIVLCRTLPWLAVCERVAAIELSAVELAPVSEGGVVGLAGAAGGSGFRRGQSSDVEKTCGDDVTNGP
jgi:hypothetical protein